MIDHLQRSEMFRKMVRESTDPQWVREQIGQPHQYSKTFTVCMLAVALSPILLFISGCWSAR